MSDWEGFSTEFSGNYEHNDTEQLDNGNETLSGLAHEEEEHNMSINDEKSSDTEQCHDFSENPSSLIHEEEENDVIIDVKTSSDIEQSQEVVDSLYDNSYKEEQHDKTDELESLDTVELSRDDNEVVADDKGELPINTDERSDEKEELSYNFNEDSKIDDDKMNIHSSSFEKAINDDEKDVEESLNKNVEAFSDDDNRDEINLNVGIDIGLTNIRVCINKNGSLEGDSKPVIECLKFEHKDIHSDSVTFVELKNQTGTRNVGNVLCNTGPDLISAMKLLCNNDFSLGFFKSKNRKVFNSDSGIPQSYDESVNVIQSYFEKIYKGLDCYVRSNDSVTYGAENIIVKPTTVISFPACLPKKSRESIRRAAEDAGFHVTATFQKSVCALHAFNSGNTVLDKYVCVVDCSSTHLELTLVDRHKENLYRIHSTVRESVLIENDILHDLYPLVLDSFCDHDHVMIGTLSDYGIGNKAEKSGSEQGGSASCTKSSMDASLISSMRLKCALLESIGELTHKEKSTIHIPDFYNGRELRYELSYLQFINVASGYLNNIFDVVRKFLDKKDLSEISYVLRGDLCNLPYVVDGMKEIFSKDQLQVGDIPHSSLEAYGACKAAHESSLGCTISESSQTDSVKKVATGVAAAVLVGATIISGLWLVLRRTNK